MRRSTVLRAIAGRSTDRLKKIRHAPRTAVLPLARRLDERKRPKRGPLASRADIVNPTLCDDIISYVGPSLSQYKNCDIIDVNPGAGLWSSKLHDFLKPRRHVLLEPDDYYKPFLQPLLDAPGSTYINGPADDTALSSVARTMHEGLLPDQHPLPKGDARLNEPNTSLLLLLNLSRIKASNTRVGYIATRDALNFLASTAWAHAGLGRYGQVRMLVWVGEYFKERVLPSDVNNVDGYGFSFCRHARTHLIADRPGPKTAREDTTVDLASAVRAADKMRSAGLSIPSHRQNRFHQMALSLLKDRNAEDIQAELRAKIIPEQSFLEELEELQARFESNSLSRINLDPWRERLEYLQSCTEKTLTDRRRFNVHFLPSLAIADEMRGLEMTITDESRPAQERLAAREQWEKLKLEFRKKLPRPQGIRRQLLQIVDQRRVFYQNPSVLQWDDRPFEPLATSPHEFYPQQSLCLLDINPKSSPREEPRREQDYWQRLACMLFDRRAQSVRQSLDIMRLGAAESIVPYIEALHDPRRGGSVDDEDVRVRTLTPEIMDELVDAWKQWTFRPEDLERKLTASKPVFDLDDRSMPSFYE